MNSKLGKSGTTAYGALLALALLALALTTTMACNSPNPAGDDPDHEGSNAVESSPPLVPQSPAEDSQPSLPPEAKPTGQTRLRAVYVPAYSHLPTGREMDRETLLSVLLSVRNVDSHATITLTHVSYFDTSGHMVRRYLTRPKRLAPLETAEFAVKTLDKKGGSGANFLVYWEGPSDAHSLLTEAVMLGQLESGPVAFTSRGVELNRRPDTSLDVGEPATSAGTEVSGPPAPR